MYVYYWDLRRFVKRAVLLTVAVLTLLVGYGLVKDNLALPTSKPYDPIWQGDARHKQIALTINVVWGEEYLPKMLQTLRKEKVKATFFVGGQFAEKYPKLVQAIAKDGHEIGNHGYNHPHPDALSQADNYDQIIKTQKIINKTAKVKTKVFAPPYGEFGESVLKAAYQADHHFIMWTIDTVDWQRPTPEVLVQRVVNRAHGGAIVLMHPTAPTAKALPQIIKELKKKGYKFKTVSGVLK